MKEIDDFVLFNCDDILSNESIREDVIYLYCDRGRYVMPSVDAAFQYSKAYIFFDDEVCDRIEHLSEVTVPWSDYIYRIGQQVEDFGEEVWREIKYNIMWSLLSQRFCYDLEARGLLLNYPGKHFVFCGTGEWSCGYDLDSAISNRSSWRENILGGMLTRMRDEIDRGTVFEERAFDLDMFIRNSCDVLTTNQLKIEF